MAQIHVKILQSWLKFKQILFLGF